MENIKKRKNLIADLSLLLVAMLWGGGFVVIKDALNSVTPFYIMAMRFGLSFLLMCLVFWKRVKRIDKKNIIGGSIIGIFLFLAFAFQTIGLQYTTAGKQAFLTAIYVVEVPFLCWIFIKKKPDNYSIAAAFLAFLGIGMLTMQGSIKINLGDALTLICSVFFAAQIISTGFYAEKLDPIVLTVVQFGVAAILSYISALIFEPKLPYLSTSVMLSVAYLSVFSTLIAFLVQNIAQKYTSSTHAAIILSLESFFGCFFAVIFLGEKLTTKIIIGCVFIFLSIITAETKWDFLKKRQENVELKKAANE
ncbi:DMT family transporter [Clostridium sp. KNHs214]|uniref:DMT family transporter n=1 Tax=Clostridium sp. KNHs214 TaxID=1540257 RepID=UPI000558016E|nr:DMT family transporter [Clostridium sp. KNHs214]